MPLPACGRGGQDPGDAGQEAEVGHVIGLVDDGDLDRVEADDALPHQVFQPARAGHDDVDAGPQRRHLTALRYTAEDRGDLELMGGCQRCQRRSDLGRQLTGGCKHQTSRATATLHGCKPGDQWDGEGKRLATASLAAAQHISTGESVRKRLLLNGERGEDSARGERLDQLVVDAEISERLLSSNCECLSGIVLHCAARE